MRLLKNIHVALRVVILLGLVMMMVRLVPQLRKSYYYANPIVVSMDILLKNKEKYLGTYLTIADGVALRGVSKEPVLSADTSTYDSESESDSANREIEYQEFFAYRCVGEYSGIKNDSLLCVYYPVFSKKQKKETRNKDISDIQSQIIVKNSTIHHAIEDTYFYDGNFVASGLLTEGSISDGLKISHLKKFKYNIKSEPLVLEYGGQQPESFYGLVFFGVILFVSAIAFLWSFVKR